MGEDVGQETGQKYFQNASKKLHTGTPTWRFQPVLGGAALVECQ